MDIELQEKIEKERTSNNADRMQYLKKTANYHLQHDDPLMNLGAEIDGRLVGFIFAEVTLWEFGRGEKTGWNELIQQFLQKHGHLPPGNEEIEDLF